MSKFTCVNPEVLVANGYVFIPLDDSCEPNELFDCLASANEYGTVYKLVPAARGGVEPVSPLEVVSLGLAI